MDVEHRQHHRGQRLARDAQRQQRHHGGGGHRVVGGLGRDQPLGGAAPEILGPFRGALRIGVGHELGSEFADPGDHAHDHPEPGRDTGDAGVARQLAQALEQAAAGQAGGADLLVLGGQQHEGLAEREEAEDHHDQVDPALQEGLIEGVALGIFHRLHADGL